MEILIANGKVPGLGVHISHADVIIMRTLWKEDVKAKYGDPQCNTANFDGYMRDLGFTSDRRDGFICARARQTKQQAVSSAPIVVPTTAAAAPSAAAVASALSKSAPQVVAPSSSGKRKAGSPDTAVGEDTELDEHQRIRRKHKLAKICKEYACDWYEDKFKMLKAHQDSAKEEEVKLKTDRDQKRNKLNEMITTVSTRELMKSEYVVAVAESECALEDHCEWAQKTEARLQAELDLAKIEKDAAAKEEKDAAMALAGDE